MTKEDDDLLKGGGPGHGASSSQTMCVVAIFLVALIAVHSATSNNKTISQPFHVLARRLPLLLRVKLSGREMEMACTRDSLDAALLLFACTRMETSYVTVYLFLKALRAQLFFLSLYDE
jgi:hypothetical protein